MRPERSREETMQSGATNRTWLAAVALLCALAPVAALRAQVSSYGDKTAGTRGDELPSLLQKVTIEQRLNQQLPLDAPFVDDHGQAVKLGDYFDGRRPVILLMVYYNCPILCSEEMDGMTGALEMVHLLPGKDFQIVVLSIDPSEGPELAAKKKAYYIKHYGKPETVDGWHFLTGQRPAIDTVAQAVWFGYVRIPGPDGKLSQFAHASSLEIVTPTGRVAQYYLGVEYSPKDMLLGLVEASGNKIGSPVANILTYCYHYDPQQNRHSLIVSRVVQMGGMVTVATLGGFIWVMFRRDLQLGRDLTAKNNSTDRPGHEGSNERQNG